MALGILTKGVGFLPIFLFIPLLYLHFVKKQHFAAPINSKLLLGPLCMLGTLFLWLAPVLYFASTKDNPDFTAYRDNILLQQTAQRYANPIGHIKPWHYFIVSVIPVLWFPLYLFLFNKKSWAEIKASPILQCLLIWVVCVIIFFSISPGKRGVYILPAVPMLALAMGAIVAKTQVSPWINKLITGFGVICAIVFSIATALAILHSPLLTKHLGDNTSLYSLLFGFAALTWVLVLWRFKLKLTLPSFGIGLGICWLLYSSLGYILLNPERTQAKEIMAQIEDTIGAEGELGLVLFKEQFLLFSTIPMTHFSYLASPQEQYRNAWLWMKERDNRYILIKQDKRIPIDCFDLTKGTLAGFAHRREWYLFDTKAMHPECAPPIQVKRYYTPQTKLYQ